MSPLLVIEWAGAAALAALAATWIVVAATLVGVTCVALFKGAREL